MTTQELRAKLDPLDAKFCDLYIQRDINNLEIADIAAKLWPDMLHPAQKAARVLKRPDVQSYLTALQSDFTHGVEMQLAEIRLRLAQDVRGVHDRFPYLEWLPVQDEKGRTRFKPHILSVDDIPPEDRRYIAMLEESDNGYYAVTLVDDLLPKDRNKAYEMLIRMQGGFNDNVNLNASVRTVTPDDVNNAPDSKAACDLYQQAMKG